MEQIAFFQLPVCLHSTTGCYDLRSTVSFFTVRRHSPSSYRGPNSRDPGRMRASINIMHSTSLGACHVHTVYCIIWGFMHRIGSSGVSLHSSQSYASSFQFSQPTDHHTCSFCFFSSSGFQPSVRQPHSQSSRQVFQSVDSQEERGPSSRSFT